MRRSLFRYTLLGACLSAPFLLAGCSSDEGVPQIFPPLRYTYLAPISLNVSSIKTVVAYAPSQDGTNLDAESPEPPIQAVQQMLQDRLTAAGSNGTATVTINTASLNRVNDTVVGNVSVQVAVTSADGRRAGYTEASVTRTRTLPDDTSYDAMRAFLYTMTSDLVNAENVELEYQIRQHLAGWLVGGVSPIGGPAAPTPVEAEPLAGPGSPAVGAAPGTGAPMPLGAPTPLGEPTPASMPAPYPAPYPAPSYPPAVPSAGITPMPMTSPAGQPQPGYPQTSYPQTSYPQTSYPQTSYPQAGTPPTAYPQQGYPQPGQPQQDDAAPTMPSSDLGLPQGNPVPLTPPAPAVAPAPEPSAAPSPAEQLVPSQPPSLAAPAPSAPTPTPAPAPAPRANSSTLPPLPPTITP